MLIASRDEHSDGLAALREDFWLFDGERVAVLHYSPDGRFLAVSDGSDRLGHYLALQQLALAAAEPLGHAAVA